MTNLISSNSSYDVIIIGSGPGGYVAAVRAAQLGMRTAIVEREHLGGICLNWGCIPTKSLLHSAKVFRTIQKADDFGVNTRNFDFNIDKIVKRSRSVSGKLNSGVGFLMKKNKIDVIWGEAKLIAPGKIEVAKTVQKPRQPNPPEPKNTLGHGIYSADHIVLATGARPRIIPGIEPDGHRIWTYFEAMIPKEIPKSLIVMGSGAIGIEFASFYRQMGADVTIVELSSKILPSEDYEISDFVRKHMEKQGINILTKAKVTKVSKNVDNISVCVDFGENEIKTLETERLISAAGVQGNIENIGLEKLGVATKSSCIIVDKYSRTNINGVYAIGDVAGAPMLAHKAEHEGIVCIEKIAGLEPKPIEKNKIPGCTYCYPQIASVGLSELQAKDKGYKIKVGRFPFAGNGKAVAMGEEEGMVKTIFDHVTGQLLGAHMVGAEVTELIQGFVVAMNLETSEEELMHTIFPHPTLSEMMHESVLSAYGRPIHM